MAMGIGGGAGLMRASFGVVRQRPALLWFPVVSTACLALTAGFWIVQGAYLYAAGGSKLLYVPLVVVGLYSLSFVGVFFNVALAGATAEGLDGDEPSFGDGMNVAWNHLGGIADGPPIPSSSQSCSGSSRASRDSAGSGRRRRSRGASPRSSSCR